MTTLAAARKALRSVVESVGFGYYSFSGNYPTKQTMSASVSCRWRDADDLFVLGVGCDPTLSYELRDMLWQENGEKLFAALKAAGFEPDPTPYGENQRRTFVVRVA